MHRLILLSTLILSGCQTVALAPPPEFAGHGLKAKVLYVSDAEALRRCGPLHPQNGGIGPACAHPAVGRCVITIGETAARTPGIIEHERAHCDEPGRQGWRHY
jgi:hypothetical protein